MLLDELKERLEPGETILWSAQPSGFETMDAAYKPKIVKRAVISIAIAAAFIGFYLYTCASKAMESKPALIVLVLAIAAYAIFSMTGDAKKLKTKMIYALTDKRIIIYTDKIHSALYSQLTNATMKQDAAGTTYVLFCDAAAETPEGANVRSLAVTSPNKDGEDFAKNLVLYGIEDAEGFKNVLKAIMPIA